MGIFVKIEFMKKNSAFSAVCTLVRKENCIFGIFWGRHWLVLSQHLSIYSTSKPTHDGHRNRCDFEDSLQKVSNCPDSMSSSLFDSFKKNVTVKCNMSTSRKLIALQKKKKVVAKLEIKKPKKNLGDEKRNGLSTKASSLLMLQERRNFCTTAAYHCLFFLERFILWPT